MEGKRDEFVNGTVVINPRGGMWKTLLNFLFVCCAAPFKIPFFELFGPRFEPCGCRANALARSAIATSSTSSQQHDLRQRLRQKKSKCFTRTGIDFFLSSMPQNTTTMGKGAQRPSENTFFQVPYRWIFPC